MSKPSPYPETFRHLISCFSRLPGIGARTAERLSLAVLQWPAEHLQEFGQALCELQQRVHPCSICGNLTDATTCIICNDSERQRDLVCVVEQPAQVIALEKSACYRGLYHVLGGKLSPLSGKGPDDLRLLELLLRVKQNVIKELIIATSSDVEGEATAHYIVDMLSGQPVTISRIATGVPAGSDLNFADAATLAIAMKGRRKCD